MWLNYVYSVHIRRKLSGVDDHDHDNIMQSQSLKKAEAEVDDKTCWKRVSFKSVYLLDFN